ncbi:MAG TPA: FAD-binding oxidoreductase [Candidatus Acidoferrales bacterium]|nr:FAD-binding oxidoreductase [Candidatus Acidoferrales bacterium]
MVQASAWQELKANLRGELLTAEHSEYESARKVFNTMIDKRPAAIARCAGAADVLACVRFARERDLLVSVRGGGHSIAGKAVCDDALMIDLSRMKGIRVDPVRRVVQAQSGLTLREFDRETQAFGLATTMGTVSMTGIAGLTLGGGLGWLMGKFGLACDNVRSLDVVTADARLLTVSAEEHSDLYWGMRGAGPNFGVVTSFEYRLHPLGPVLAGVVAYRREEGEKMLKAYRDFSRSIPAELTTGAGFLTLPDGTPVAVIPACYAGKNLPEGDAVLRPLRSQKGVLADMIKPGSYLDMQTALDWAFPPNQCGYWKSAFLKELSDDAIRVLVRFGATLPTPLSMIILEHMHGAAAEVAPDATAFPHRGVGFNLLIVASWPDPRDNQKNIGWVRELWAAMEPFMRPGNYVNYLSEGEGEDRVRAAYGANHARLVALKNKYDPTNFFRVNQNIRPAATPAS